MPRDTSVWLGMVFFVLLFYPAWSPRCRRLRKRMHSTDAKVSGNGIHVSPTSTATADALEADMETWGVGPDWVQDEPYPELFDDKE